MQIDSTGSIGSGSKVASATISTVTQGVTQKGKEGAAASGTSRVELSHAAKSLSQFESTEGSDKEAGTGDGSGTEQKGVEDAQSFVCGVLGLDDPQAPPKPRENGFYTVGKWVSAAASAGTLISLLV